MNKLILLFCLWSFSVFSQSKDSSKIGINVSTGFGNSQLEHSSFGRLNGNYFVLTNNLIYNINEKLTISTGYELVSFNANFYHTNLNTNLNNRYLQIPLNISLKNRLSDGYSDRIRLIMGLGLKANYLSESIISTVNSESKEEYLGWNFGFNANFGLNLKIKNNANLGLLFDYNKDFNDITYNGVSQKTNYSTGFKLNLSTYF